MCSLSVSRRLVVVMLVIRFRDDYNPAALASYRGDERLLIVAKRYQGGIPSTPQWSRYHTEHTTVGALVFGADGPALQDTRSSIPAPAQSVSHERGGYSSAMIAFVE